jgi:hypothetical protein
VKSDGTSVNNANIYVCQFALNAHLQREILEMKITQMKMRDNWCQPEKRTKANTWTTRYRYSALVPLHAMKPYEEADVQIHPLLNLTLGTGEMSATRFGYFIPWESAFCNCCIRS